MLWAYSNRVKENLALETKIEISQFLKFFFQNILLRKKILDKLGLDEASLYKFKTSDLLQLLKVSTF